MVFGSDHISVPLSLLCYISTTLINNRAESREKLEAAYGIFKNEISTSIRIKVEAIRVLIEMHTHFHTLS